MSLKSKINRWFKTDTPALSNKALDILQNQKSSEELIEAILRERKGKEVSAGTIKVKRIGVL